MKVTLLRLDGLDTAMLGASVCVTVGMPTEPEPGGLVNALKSGHDSLLEHVTLSFAIEGISRVCLAQLCRHRHISLSVQSQRYIVSSGNPAVVPRSIEEAVDDSNALFAMKRLDTAIDRAIEALREVGVPDEDIRYIYPQGITTNLILTTNFREFSHMCGLRRCRRAQDEIHELFDAMAQAVDDRLVEEFPMDMLDPLYYQLYVRMQPQCRQIGYCPEVRSCGARPSLEKLMEGYAANLFQNGTGSENTSESKVNESQNMSDCLCREESEKR